MPSPDVAVVVCTYQMPGHLARVLASLKRQTLAAQMEVIISDDGSSDETEELVARYARQVRFPVQFVTHQRDGFQLARCRNDGFLATAARHVLFLDGDCLVPPDHLAQHLASLRPGIVTNGYCVRLDQPTSERITIESAERGDFTRLRPAGELRKLAMMQLKSTFYNLIRHPRKPNLRGGNVGVCRDDFLRVNGLDENFRAWGGEDDDLGWRMRAAGLRIESVLHRTRTYHLWHPPSPTKVEKHHQQHHFDYLYRPFRLSRCLDGVVKRQPEDLRVRIVGQPGNGPLAQKIMRQLGLTPRPWPGQVVDLEFLVLPGNGRFTRQAECAAVIVLGELSAADMRQTRHAHVVLSRDGSSGSPQQLRIKLGESAALWAALGGRELGTPAKRAA